MRVPFLLLTISLFPLLSAAQESPATFPGTEPLKAEQPLDVLMVEGIDQFSLKELDKARQQRESLWKRDYSSPQAYQSSLEPYRQKLRTYIGAVDQRVQGIQFERPLKFTGLRAAETKPAQAHYEPQFQRWPVLPGMTAEGLILVPQRAESPRGIVIAIPDSRWSPDVFAGATEQGTPSSKLPQVLAENGFLVVIPTLIDRTDEFAGNPLIAMTNQTNREWVYRSAFEVGRHVIGYEVQKVLAAIDALDGLNQSTKWNLPISLVGIGDGGQIALYSAAIDARPASVLVSGYFQPREGVWQEPIDRNVWRQLVEFGDAEIAGMIAPRPLIIEACAIPETDGPLPVQAGRRGGAAPGQIKTADLAQVRIEFDRAKAIYEKLKPGNHIVLVESGSDGRGPAASSAAIMALAQKSDWRDFKPEARGKSVPLTEAVNWRSVQGRQVGEAIDFTQKLLRNSFKVRDQLFAKADRSSVEKWESTAEPLRDHVYNELIGKLPEPSVPLNPRTRKVLETDDYTGYEVVLDTYPDVIAAGILLYPKGVKADEKRPVVVCQHGLEGVPMDTISGPGTEGYHYYKGFAAELARRGFIAYSPQNPYRGKDRFRTLQRKSNPVGRSLFSYIIPQHQVTLKWLASLPAVDPNRLAFYGLSYGGKTAVRVPPMLTSKEGRPGYCLSICSADFNEWVTKNASVDLPFSYVFTNEYEIFEWNMAHVANYAELSILMTPRPFMVERGHDDGVGLDEWVGFEYAKVRRHYSKLGIPEQTEIEFFNGPHTINGKGTYDFLHRHLNWPKK
ncbi:alpha/beta hydrolase family protein [Schlesneria sp. T3-172]|uniref:alpha/beta hydrolase family protein n=1 Tax=Schlesneria sphaerica TaxID=3373610 RepID=UPI0037C9F5B2